MRIYYTTEIFIEKAKTHPNHINCLYTKTVFVSWKEKICITCPIHGDFWQRSKDHIAGAGCPKCANQNTGIRCRFDQEELIKLLNKKHNYKYTYENVIYKGEHYDIIVTCPKHGNFSVKAYSHIAGIGCINCGYESSAVIRRKTTDQFILDDPKYIVIFLIIINLNILHQKQNYV
jgi:Zn ribbon nucleic-acid-binding protein